MKVVLSPNPYRDRGLRAAQFARRVLERGGVDTVICLPFEVDESSRLDIPGDLPRHWCALAEMEPSFTPPVRQLRVMFLCWGSIWAASALWRNWSMGSYPCCPGWQGANSA